MKNLLKTLFDKTFFKYFAVGCFNTVVGNGIMFTAYHLLRLPDWLSFGANYFFTSILSYFLNKRFTFGKKGRSPRTAMRFAMNIALCCTIAFGIAKPIAVWLLAGAGKTAQDYGAMLSGQVLFVILNYLGQRFFTFRDREVQQNTSRLS